MKEDILTTMFYLSIVFLGSPTIYYLTTSERLTRKRKNNVLIVYSCAVFIIILLPVLYYGAENTKRAIGSGFGELVMFLFYSAIIILLILSLLVLLLGNWSMWFRNLKKKIIRKP